MAAPAASSEQRRSASSPAVTLEDVGMVFQTRKGAVKALENVSFQVEPSEFVSIVGPSGCGKSTILRLVAGLLAPTSGRVLVDGESPSAARLARRFGFVFQQSVMLSWRTALQNVTLPLEIVGRRADQTRIPPAQLLQMVGLQGYEHLYPRQLSGGMRQRVAIARALSFDPPILLMDEPFGALDALTRDRLHGLLLGLWESDKKTVLFITHDVYEAVLLSDWVGVLTSSPGRVRAVVPVDLPRPRSDAIRGEAVYMRLVQTILAMIKEEPQGT